MPGENETTTEVVEQTTEQTTEQMVEPEAAQQPEPKKPHPLEPGGERWNEIYRERSDYKREAESLRAENERLRTQPAKPEAAQPRVYSEAELQGYVDAGKITPAQMAAQISLQVSAATEQRIEAKYEQRTRAESARAEVNAYIAKVPALNDTGSPAFQRVATEAHRISQEIGLPTTDTRVQRLALGAALGPLDRIAKTEQARDFDRQHADTHTETGGGGGQRAAAADPLKNVEPARLDHWKRLGYTRARMIEEAGYIRRPLRSR